jgi:hypothetical protein
MFWHDAPTDTERPQGSSGVTAIAKPAHICTELSFIIKTVNDTKVILPLENSL